MPDDNQNTSTNEKTGQSDQTNQESGSAQAGSGEQPTLLAGKYKTEADLHKGISELAGKLEMAELVPAAFKDAEHAESVYKALSRHQGRLSAINNPPADGEDKPLEIPKPGSGDDGASDMTAIQVMEKAGLDGTKIAQQWKKDGKLTDEQYEAIRKIKPAYSKQDINEYIAGLEARAQIQQQAQHQAKRHAAELAGGKLKDDGTIDTAPLDNLLKFAAILPEHRRADLNERLGDPRRYEGAVKELLAEHREAVGAGRSNPLIEEGMPTGGDTVRPFGNAAEMSAMRKDPKMKNDPAFKKLYEARVKITPQKNVSSVF